MGPLGGCHFLRLLQRTLYHDSHQHASFSFGQQKRYARERPVLSNETLSVTVGPFLDGDLHRTRNTSCLKPKMLNPILHRPTGFPRIRRNPFVHDEFLARSEGGPWYL